MTTIKSLYRLCFFILIAALLATSAPLRIAQADEDIPMLVNYNNVLDADYVPTDMMNLAEHIRSTKKEILMRADAANAFIEMYNTMVSDGAPKLILISGYRDYNLQKTLFNNRISSYRNSGYDYDSAYSQARRLVAPPGQSEHQTGLAIDVSTNSSLSTTFQNTVEGKWLKKYAYLFGFVIRYTADKEPITKISNEPWHLRYVGLPHSQIMFENDLCLEEYIEAYDIYNDSTDEDFTELAKEYVLSKGSTSHKPIQIIVNDSNLLFIDKLPFIWDKNVYVPVRQFASQLGLSVEWVKADTPYILVAFEDKSIKLLYNTDFDMHDDIAFTSLEKLTEIFTDTVGYGIRGGVVITIAANALTVTVQEPPLIQPQK